MLIFLKKYYYFFLIVIPILCGIDIWNFDSYIVRTLLMPLMVLIIYCALLNLQRDKDNLNMNRRTILFIFNFIIIILCASNIIQTLCYIIKYGVNIIYEK